MRFSKRFRKASILGAFFVSVLASLPARALCPLEGPSEQVRVASVIDGDTLRLQDGKSVRLIGLNAPEIRHRGQPAEPYAEAARRRLQALVDADDGYVKLQRGLQAKDAYGRLLAHAFDRQGRNLEAVLLEEGLGYFVAIAPNTALAGCHQPIEREARQARKGLWRDLSPVSPRDLRQGGFALLKGRIERVETNRSGVWLEFDGPLVVQIPSQALEHFEEGFLDNLSGRRVEVRGWVVDRKGRVRSSQARWLIKITHPSMLDFLSER